MAYKVFYKGKDANYPEFETEEKALDFYLDCVKRETGETEEEILDETWTSPRGVENCVEVREVKGEKND